MYYITSTSCSIRERQTKTKGKVYDVYCRVITEDGREKQKKLSGYKTKALAKKGYAKFVADECRPVKAGEIKKADPDKDRLYVAPLIREYLSSLSNQNKESSIYDKGKIYDKFIVPVLGEMEIEKLDTRTLYQWQDEIWRMKNSRTGEYFSSKYLLKIRAHLNSFLGYCESRYGIPNRLKDVKLPKKRTGAKTFSIWSMEEFETFLSAADDPMYHALFTLLFYTGRRKGEILALTQDDIRKDGILISKSITRKTLSGDTYGITTTKADKSQLIPVCGRVRTELASYRPMSPFLFGGSHPVADNTLRRRFLEYTEKAGLPQIRIHDLRHSFVSMLLHMGANLMVVADLIGDTVEQVTKTYGHMYESDKLKIIARLP